MKTLSLYSGAGGIDLGFKKNKFHTLLAIENWDKACETLKEKADEALEYLTKLEESIN